MKKFIVILLTTVFGLSLNSCNPFTDSKAIVNVKVTKAGVAQEGISVYMFTSSKWNQTDKRYPTYCSKQIITDSEGVAMFDLATMDLELTETQSTFYFATFDKDGKKITGKTACTIKKGETVDKELKIE